MEELSEKQIIEKIKQGQIDYFGYLVKKYSRIIYFYVKQKVDNEDDADDIVQNTFIKAYKAVDKFDENKNFYPFLFVITKNEIAQFYRTRKKHIRLDEKISIETNATEEQNNIKELIFRLKPDYQKVISLFIEGYSYLEISRKLNKPINTVKTLIRRAKIQIKSIWKK